MPHRIADHQGDAPTAEREGVVPVAAGGTDRTGPVVAPGQREIREQRQVIRQQGVPNLLDDVRVRLRPLRRPGIPAQRLDHQQHGPLARDADAAIHRGVTTGPPARSDWAEQAGVRPG